MINEDSSGTLVLLKEEIKRLKNEMAKMQTAQTLCRSCNNVLRGDLTESRMEGNTVESPFSESGTTHMSNGEAMDENQMWTRLMIAEKHCTRRLLTLRI